MLEARRLAREDLDRAAPLVVAAHVDRLLGRNGQEKASHGEFAKLVSPFYKLLTDRGLGGGISEKDMAEMTGDEIRAVLDVARVEVTRLENVIADRAKPIELVPVSTPGEDLFG